MFKTFALFIVATIPLRGNGQFFFNPFLQRSAQQTQQCRLRNNLGIGVCVNFSQCRSAQAAYYNFGVQPVVCARNPFDPIVCCPSSGSQSGRSSQKNPSRNVGQSGVGGGGQISQLKCQERYAPQKQMLRTLVVGGVRTAPGEFPHMAAIGWRKRLGSGYEYSCGGSLISPNFVLTAAHCASIGGAAPEVVRTGGDNLDDASVPDIPIENVIVHPQYRRRQVYNDIALIKLRSSSGHKPACLWTSGGATQQQVQGIGYGHTQFAGRGSKQLMKVILKIFSNQECSRYYTPGSKLESGIINSQVCAGDPNKAMDTCQGDSGGPIVLKANDKGTEIPYVVGITSFGQGCAGGPPSIYTRVTSYLGWIESIVWPSG